MKKLYSLLLLVFIINGAGNAAGTQELRPSDTTKSHKTETSPEKKAKITDTRKNKPGILNTGISISLKPFKPVIFKKAAEDKLFQEEDKVLSNVKVYPNPVQDELNLSYCVNKDSNVTIQIMDVLGNEIATLLSQKLTAGEQLNTFNITSRLNSGFYFLRVTAGNETVVKRISVL